jgi:phage shock protein C
MAVKKKLYRSDEDKVLAGLLGGMGDYFYIDPTILRLAYVLIVFVTGVIPGFVVYFIAMLVVPKQPATKKLPAKKAK